MKKVNVKIISLTILVISMLLTGGITVSNVISAGGIADGDPSDGGMG